MIWNSSQEACAKEQAYLTETALIPQGKDLKEPAAILQCEKGLFDGFNKLDEKRFVK